MSKRTIRLATRGSSLARRQAATVKSALENRRRSVELVTVETRGDQLQDELIHRLGRTGAFVRSLDEKVMAGELDGAIHSMKDMPTEMPSELVVAGLPERASPNDMLLTPEGRTLDDLPHNAVVGTSSLRRKAQLLAERPDLEVTPLRGNVDTRIEKLLAPTLQREHERRLSSDDDDDEIDLDDESQDWFDSLAEIERRALERTVDTEYDAIVLAAAGLERSGLAPDVPTQPLDPTTFVPAPAQGTIAVTALSENEPMIRQSIDHPPTRVTASVERTILGGLGGGCVAPIGVFARLRGEYVNTVVRVLSQDGSETIEETRDIPVVNHLENAQEFASELRDAGGAELIERATRETPTSPSRQE